MTPIILVLVLSALSFGTVVSENQLCAAVCTCVDILEEDSFFLADCSRVYLSIVPPVTDWPVKLTHMDLSANNISALQVEMVHETLQVLDLSHNHIGSIVQSAFGGLKNLKHLDLSYNVIEKFEDNAFYGVEGLLSLNVSGNKIKAIPDNLFYSLFQLEHLSLSDNALVHLHPEHFNKMVSLKSMDLSNIGAYSLPANIFHLLEHLEFLDLSSNEFQEVPNNAIRSATNLNHLRFNENPVEKLEKKDFLKLESLEVLELSYMENLRRVGPQTFSSLTKLRVLEMNFNRYLNWIDQGAFEGLYNASRPVLQEVSLEQNDLSLLSAGTFACARMRRFNLQRNPWFCDCRLKWIKTCQIQQIYSADLKCKGPGQMANSLIANIDNEDFKCDRMAGQIMLEETAHHDKVVRSISLAVGCTLLVAMALGIAFVLKKRELLNWWNSERKGPGAVYYVKARAHPREI